MKLTCFQVISCMRLRTTLTPYKILFVYDEVGKIVEAYSLRGYTPRESWYSKINELKSSGLAELPTCRLTSDCFKEFREEYSDILQKLV